MTSKKLFLLPLLCTLAAGSLAQNESAEFNGGIPVAPTGLQNLPLEDGPWEFRTGEDMNIHVELVARMEYAMAMAFLPDDSMLVVTRLGKLFHVADGKKMEISGGPESMFFGESGGIGSVHGYIDIALHPEFEDNGFIYLSFSRPDEDLPIGVEAIGRGRLTGSSLEDFEVIYDTKTLNGPGNIVFGPDGKLYASMPDGSDAQNLGYLGGKIIRLNDDGSIPEDNPFVDNPDALPEIYSYGHRSVLGLSVHAASGSIWASENGPNGGDEINIVEAGENYGWPEVTYGRSYNGPWESGSPHHQGYKMPEVIWIPSVAVSGLTFYTGDKLSKWKGDLFVGALREGEVNGTGHLERILFNSDMQELRRENLLVDLHKRIRDVEQGPDGYLYVALEDKDGGVLRIMPVE